MLRHTFRRKYSNSFFLFLLIQALKINVKIIRDGRRIPEELISQIHFDLL